MRDLTEYEISQIPKGATHYNIGDNDLVYYLHKIDLFIKHNIEVRELPKGET